MLWSDGELHQKPKPAGRIAKLILSCGMIIAAESTSTNSQVPNFEKVSQDNTTHLCWEIGQRNFNN